MKNDLIREAFRTATPTADQKERMRSALEAQLPKETTAQGRYQQRHTPPRRFSWIPAVAALFVVVIFGGFVLGRLYGGTGALAPAHTETTVPQTTVSQAESETVREFLASGPYQANVEWNAYLQTREEESSQGLKDPYPHYGCTDDGMARDLDALCETYGLSLPGNVCVMDDYFKLLDIVQVDTIIKMGEDVTYQYIDYSFCYYQDGSFTFGGTLQMTAEESPWSYPVEFCFYRIMKDTFHQALLEIGDITRYESWEYTSSDGVDLLLAVDTDKALILAPRERDLLLVVTTDSRAGDVRSGEHAMDRASMEALAENFDFTLPPEGGLAPIPEQKAVAREQLNVYLSPSLSANVVAQIPAGTEIKLQKREWVVGKEWAFIEGGWIDLEMVDITYGETSSETVTTEFDPALYRYDYILEKYVTAIDEGWDGAQCSEADISILVRDVKSPDGLGYALMDLDCNGNKELLITDGNVIYDLYTLLDDGPCHLLMGSERNAYFLCEGNVLKNTGSNSAASSFTSFFKLDGIDFRYQDTVSFSADMDPENPWFLGSNDSDALTPITEEEANAVMDSYTVLPIETRPLTEKP